MPRDLPRGRDVEKQRAKSTFPLANTLSWLELLAVVLHARRSGGLIVLSVFDGLGVSMYIFIVCLRLPVKNFIIIEKDEMKNLWCKTWTRKLRKYVEATGGRITVFERNVEDETLPNDILRILNGAPLHVFLDVRLAS